MEEGDDVETLVRFDSLPDMAIFETQGGNNFPKRCLRKQKQVATVNNAICIKKPGEKEEKEEGEEEEEKDDSKVGSWFFISANYLVRPLADEEK